MTRRFFAMVLVCTVLLFSVSAPVCADGGAGISASVLKKTQNSVAFLYVLGYRNGSPSDACVGTCFAVGTAGRDTDVFLTNWHTVTLDGQYSTDNVRVWILQKNCRFNSDGTPDSSNSIECEILKTTSGYPDYAIIRMQSFESGYKALPLLSSECIDKGTPVYALGFPAIVEGNSVSQFGAENVTATDGIISRFGQLSAAGNTNVIFHTATISEGNSGGPLITKNGAVVGINTYGLGENDTAEYSCAIYIDYAMRGLDDLGISYSVYHGASIYIAVAAVIVIAAAVAAIIFVRKKREEEARQKAEEERRMAEAEAHQRAEAEARRKAEEEARRRAMIPKFRLVSDDGRSFEIPSNGAVVAIGRDPSCQVCYPSGSKGVSRRHCTVAFQQNTVVLTDLNSSYGTYIHGNKIPGNTPVALHAGSFFCLGGPNSNRLTVQS